MAIVLCGVPDETLETVFRELGYRFGEFKRDALGYYSIDPFHQAEKITTRSLQRLDDKTVFLIEKANDVFDIRDWGIPVDCIVIKSDDEDAIYYTDRYANKQEIPVRRFEELPKTPKELGKFITVVAFKTASSKPGHLTRFFNALRHPVLTFWHPRPPRNAATAG